MELEIFKPELLTTEAVCIGVSAHIGNGDTTYLDEFPAHTTPL